MVSRGDTEKDVKAPRRQPRVRLKGAVCFMDESVCSHRKTPSDLFFIVIVVVLLLEWTDLHVQPINVHRAKTLN